MDWAGEVSALYNQYVHSQQSFFSFCSEALVERLELKPGARVLDLAGGAGITSRLILAKVDADITILDASSEQLEHSRAVFRDKVSYVQTRAELYTPEKQFDVIVCANAFWYLQQSIIPKLASWLAPGGILLFNLHEQNTELKENSFLSHVYLQVDALARERFHTSCLIYQRITAVEELKHVLRLNGFTVETSQLSFEEPKDNWKVFCELEGRRTAPYMALSISPEAKLALFREAFKTVAKQSDRIERHTLLFVCKK